jgi:hypothetical protein
MLNLETTNHELKEQVMSEINTQVPAIHLSIDIETVGLTTDAGIISIAAIVVPTESTSIVVPQCFYEKISLAYIKAEGLFNINEATLSWWDKQPVEAREDSFDGLQTSTAAIIKFAEFIDNLPSDNIYLWANSPNFDLTLLENHFYALGIHKPKKWNFKNFRDLRTLVSLVDSSNLVREHIITKTEMSDIGYAHTAIADAQYQAYKIKHCMNLLNLEYLL